MPEAAAAWVRLNVWTADMRLTFAKTPGFYLRCSCQSGQTTWCRSDRCHRCHRAEPLRSAATAILRPGGKGPAYFAEPYAHKADISATGPHHEWVALVWLADRICRWVCPHACHQATVSERRLATPAANGTASLFELAIA